MVTKARQTQTSSVDLKGIDAETFKRIMHSVCPEFVIDDFNRQLMNDLFFYVNEKPGRLDPNKGILLWGNVGTGKSTIIKILGEELRCRNQGYKTVNCSYLATQYSAIGLDALNQSTYNEGSMGARPVNRAFDELGREPIPAKHYGNDLNVMQYVFQCRYELRYSVRTFATTNMPPASLSKIYGEYIFDRINEMFNIVELSGSSRRK